jgi:hypothetical protein
MLFRAIRATRQGNGNLRRLARREIGKRVKSESLRQERNSKPDLAWAAESIARDGTIRLPFGGGRTSAIDSRDVAEVVTTLLTSPTAHINKFMN